jgi:ADP-heptose:LPS heptosyltransferase
LTHNLIYNYYLHTSKSYFLLARALSKIPQGTKPTPLIHEDVDNIKITLPKIESSDASKKRILSRIADENPKMRRYINKDRIILIAPNSSQMLILRKWPIENYIGLIRQILKNHRDVLVVLTGSSSDVQEASMIESSVGEERCINFTGRTTMKELIDLYNVSDVLVTHDGGPAHFASLTEIKTITLFGTETPLLWGPIGKNNISITANLACSPCINIFNQRKSPCTNNYCLQAIKVDKVYDIVDELLNEKKIHESKGSIKELIKIKTRI